MYGNIGMNVKLELLKQWKIFFGMNHHSVKTDILTIARYFLLDSPIRASAYSDTGNLTKSLLFEVVS